MNLYHALRSGFCADLDTIAISTSGEAGEALHYSWRDLERGSAMLANLLASLDLPPASRIAVQVEKSVEALMLYLATLRAGHVFLPLNTAYQSSEVAYFLGNAEPAVVVCSPRQFGWVSKLAFQAGTRHVFTLGDDRSGSLLVRAVHFADVHEPVERAADDLAAILYTSGTTGRSKGAMLSHGNLLSNAQTLHRYWGFDAPPPGGDVLIHALPIFHVHGLFVAIHAALLSGSRMRWFARFDALAVLQAMRESTVFMGVPTLYVRLLNEAGLDREASARMRLFVAGSAPLLADTFEAWHQRTGHTIVERYGMSETVMLTSNPYRLDPRWGGQSERRAGTVGMPLPGVSVRVADAQDQVLAVGEVGGIQVRGPNVFAGYWRMPDKTAEEFTSDGFFRTGDVGLQDERGYVRIVGRSKDLIISGGYNVYPAEVEDAINALPGVAESAVIGVPHPDFGEVGVALVIARPGSKPDPVGVLQSLKGSLANFKVPKRCLLVDELPRNAMGKVQKNLLRQQHQALFASS